MPQANPFNTLGHLAKGSAEHLLNPTGTPRAFNLRGHPKPATVKFGTLTATRALVGFVDMSNVLSEEKKKQVIALGKLGWSWRRIEEATGVRR
jgi:hypothetical protein